MNCGYYEHFPEWTDGDALGFTVTHPAATICLLGGEFAKCQGKLEGCTFTKEIREGRATGRERKPTGIGWNIIT